MIILKNEEAGIIITLDDTSERGFDVAMSDDMKERFENDPEMIKEIVDHYNEDVEFERENVFHSPEIPLLEKQVAEIFIEEGFEIIVENHPEKPEDRDSRQIF